MHEIVIVTAADKGYEQHSAAMFASLFCNNNSGARFKIFLLSSAPNPEQIKLQRFVRNSGHTLELLRLDESIMKSFKITHHVSLATYYRLFIPNLLPKETDKILYLDSDMIILDDISPLWALNLENCYGAARRVPEKEFDRFDILEIERNHPYFYAGVLLWNLKEIRKINFTERAIEYLHRKKNDIEWWDMDVLNYMMQNRIKLFEKNWHIIAWEDIPLSEIKILHFAGSTKPWTYPQKYEFDKEYFRYLWKTPWKKKFFRNRYYLSYKLKSLLGK